MKLIALTAAAATAAVLLVTPAQGTRPGITQHDQQVIRFFAHHPALALTPAGQRALWSLLAHISGQVRTMQSAREAAPRVPPHHALWECISRYEGPWDNHGPGHYGGLQMTWNWLGYIRGDAGALPQAEQEWAAERAWSASGYSYSFLVGQWYAYDAADGCGTTG